MFCALSPEQYLHYIFRKMEAAGPPKHWYPTTSLCSATTQTMTSTFITMKTSNLALH